MSGFDPFGSMQAMMQQFQQFRSNPMQFMAQRRLNIPQNLINNPQAAIQHLMNNGQMSQEQFNQLQGLANRIQQNPQFMQMMGGRK